MNAHDTMTIARGRITIPAGDGLLRLALKLDAVVTAANGAAYLAGAGLLDTVLGVPASAQRPIGVFLLLFAAALWYVATRPVIGRAASAAIVEANVAWVLASVGVLVLDWHSPTPGGSVWIALQAVVVALFAALQFEGRLLARR
jgi:hypothetical protein